MRLRYTTPALADLNELARYLGRRSPQAARLVRRRIKSLIEQLTDQPLSGKVTEDPTIRRLATAPYPYLIFFEATDVEIIVHAVRHGACDPALMPGSTSQT